MYSTQILQDLDFWENSKYSSWSAEEKLEDWEYWAEVNLPEKDKKEITRAMKKM